MIKGRKVWTHKSYTFDGEHICVCCCESCTWPISTKPAPQAADELGLTLGSCFLVRRLELAAVAVILLFGWCVSTAAGFIYFRFYSLRTPSAYGKYQEAL